MTINEISAFVITFVLAFCLTLLCVPLAVYLGKRFHIISRPGGRRRNPGDYKGVSKLGGLAVYIGFTSAVIASQYLNIPRFDPMESVRLTGLILGSTFVFLIGVLDDIFELSPVSLGSTQIIAAGIAIAFQIFIEFINNPFTGQQTDPWSYIVTVVLSMFWLGLMMNTVNFMDGLDGLVAGVAFIAGTTLFINSAFILNPAQTSVSLLPLALMGASLGFLMFNFFPARIFLGGGAIYIGYLLGTLSIIGGAKMATILLVMGLPLMDLAWQVFRRMREGRNPMHGDRGHLHFRLQDAGYTQRQIVSAYYLFCSLFGILTLVVTSQLFKFVAFSVMVLLILLAFVWIIRVDQAGSSKSS